MSTAEIPKKSRKGFLKAMFVSVAGAALLAGGGIYFANRLEKEHDKKRAENAAAARQGWQLTQIDPALFETSDTKSGNLFLAVDNSKNPFRSVEERAIKEFRLLSGSVHLDQLAADEKKNILAIRDTAKILAPLHGMSAPAAATMIFAAQCAGIDPGTFLSCKKPDFKTAEWLYMIRHYGAAHGLGFFADQVQETDSAALTLKNPVMLEPVLNLQKNPRIYAVMAAEYIKNQAHIPPHVTTAVIRETPDENVRRLQNTLPSLGFGNKRPADGIMDIETAAAVQDFSSLTKNTGKSLDSLAQFAEAALAKATVAAKKFSKVDQPLSPASAFAIDYACKLTGADYPTMMLIAETESGFVDSVTVRTSSAQGLYQFIDNTWGVMLYTRGGKYGYDMFNDQMSTASNGTGDVIIADIKNPFIDKCALSLRSKPLLNAIMGAESLKENTGNLVALTRRTPTRADQYLAHFMGPGAASRFLKLMENDSTASAAAAFPRQAADNKWVFYRDGQAQSLAEVYKYFARKFDTKFYDLPPPKRTTPRHGHKK